MVKPITEYSKEELEAKIEAIKAERERTAEALKRYEEELERRKQEVPLGVPHEGWFFVNGGGKAEKRYYMPSLEERDYNCFDTPESAQRNAEMLLAWRKALVANANGNQIDIKVLSPLLEKGKVAFCPISRSWFWAKETPQLMDDTWGISGNFSWIGGFNIKPADDWKTSLMECGL